MAAFISLIGALLVISVVVFIMATSSVEEDKNTAKGKVYKLRGKYFFVLVGVIAIGLIASLRFLPYSNHNGTPDALVNVVGVQWAWIMAESDTPMTSWDEVQGGDEIELPVDKLIQFRVTAKDVNHNFAIYNSRGDLVTQVQAMPYYFNNLYYKFKEKGEYQILCLEYCGMPHAFMVGKIHVN